MTAPQPSVRQRLCSALALCTLALSGTLAAQDAAVEAPTEAEAQAASNWREGLEFSRHELTLGERTLAYRATTGTMQLREEDGSPRADMFFVAYTLDEQDSATRPVTFCFNGGPGSSSVWLHMGAWGPRRVRMPEDPVTPAPPFGVEDNPFSLLVDSDLVFIDPVTTGYSRAAEGVDDSDFHGVNEDIDAVAEFIRLWTTRFERWSSPKFLAGESYGTTRAAGLASRLQDQHGMSLNGIVLVSSILNFQTARFDAGNDLPYPLFLPTYTATAWYHGRLAPDLQSGELSAALEASQEFALGEYTSALALGDRLPADRAASVAAQLARLTGLSEDYLVRSHLRPVIHEFCKELQRDEAESTGRLDSRFTGHDADGVGSGTDYDPSYSAIVGPFTAGLNAYLRGELGYENDLPYEILTGRVHPWNYGNGNRYVDTADRLRSAMSKNPSLKVFVANGYYDLATPYFATEYTISHMALPAALRDNVSMAYYEAGHMMYIHEPSAAKLAADLSAFYASASTH
ncbi:MAG: peptidase S10 [Planctomycetota bacterium]|nr:MAG: peptidase S10 [Planctomycetota bacterium]